MSYTVISVFPETANIERVKSELLEQGFLENDIVISQSRFEENSSIEDYEEDENTRNFWDYLFANDTELLDTYSRESVAKTDVIVYADQIEDARKAREITKSLGAIDVTKKTVLETGEDEPIDGISQEEYDGIIAKARHNIYLLDSERVYRPNSRGMSKRMDSLGSKD